MQHPPGDRARRLAALSVELADVGAATLHPLEREHLAAWLAQRLHRRGLAGCCDLSLRFTRQWAERRRLDPDAVCARALLDHAVCDCELAGLVSVHTARQT